MAYSIGQELDSLGIVLEVIHHLGFEGFASGFLFLNQSNFLLE